MRHLAIATSFASALLLPHVAEAACNGDSICSGGPLRVMFIVDASSDRLNDQMDPAPQDTSDWDMMRRVLAGPGTSAYDAVVDGVGIVASQVSHVGLIAFGSTGEEVVMVDYAPCSEDRVGWALDPRSSCEAPGCTNPWAGPPITWTFVDGSTIDPPNFILPTMSHMPRCDEGTDAGCSGSERFVHLGVGLSRSNRNAYLASTPFTSDDTTTFVNILLVGDAYSGSSSSADVQSQLETAFAEGIVTYVVGYGGGIEVMLPTFAGELDDMANWGSGGTKTHYEAETEQELADAIAAILADVQAPCCHTIDCADFGGADDGGGGGTMGDTAATWGSADGDGSASASDSEASAGTMTEGSASASDTEGDSGKIDDDGGCTCNAAAPRLPAFSLLLLLVLARRRGSASLHPRGGGCSAGPLA